MKTAGTLGRVRCYRRQPLDADIVLCLLVLVSRAQMAQQGQPEDRRQSRHSWHPWDGKTRVAEMAGALGYQEASRRVHESFKGCWHLQRTHEVETEILISHYHQDPTFTLGWYNLECTVSLLRKNITIHQASDRYTCTGTHTQVLYADVCIDIMCSHASLIIFKSMYIFFSPESQSRLKK